MKLVAIEPRRNDGIGWTPAHGGARTFPLRQRQSPQSSCPVRRAQRRRLRRRARSSRSTVSAASDARPVQAQSHAVGQLGAERSMPIAVEARVEPARAEARPAPVRPIAPACPMRCTRALAIVDAAPRSVSCRRPRARCTPGRCRAPRRRPATPWDRRSAPPPPPPPPADRPGTGARRRSPIARGEREQERQHPHSSEASAIRLPRPAGRSSSAAPVWQAGPAGSTISHSASWSQSTRISTTRSTLPDVSPLRHSLPRLRDQKCRLAAPAGGGEGLGIHVRDHQHRAGAVGHHRRDQPSGCEARIELECLVTVGHALL